MTDIDHYMIVPTQLLDLLRLCLGKPKDQYFIDERVGWLAAEHFYIEIMKAHRSLSNELGQSNLEDIKDQVFAKGFFTEICTEVVNNLVCCKWLFHIIPGENGEEETLIQPIFDQTYLTWKQFNNLVKAIERRSLVQLNKYCPVRKPGYKMEDE